MVIRTKTSFLQAVPVISEATCQPCALAQTRPPPKALVTAGQERGRACWKPRGSICWGARARKHRKVWGQEETQKARLGVCTSLRGLPAACGNLHVASSSLPGLVNAGRCRSRGKLLDPGNAGQEGHRSGHLMPHLMLLPCPCDGSGERAEKAVEGWMHPYRGKMARSRPSEPLGYGGAVTGASALSHRHSNGGIGDG